jgi:serine protease Do
MEPKDRKNEPKTSTFTVGNRRPPYSRLAMVRFPRVRKLYLIVAILFIGCFGLGFLGGLVGANQHRITSLDSNSKKQIISSESQLISEIAKDVGPSVVSIDVTGQVQASGDFFGFGGGQSAQQQSAGTGFVVSSDGIVVTNRHVVPSGTSKVSVTLSDGTTLDNVSVIGRTNESDSLDIAFLKINDKKGKTLKPIPLGDSSKMQVGDKVIAIGNALGQFQNTVTAGIISGYGRSLQAGDQGGGSTESLEDLFQTDAAINEGNSGGPLVNTNGDVIGINTAIAGDAQNVGFAIPINDVKGLINSVLKEGKLLRPYLGVRYVSLTPDVATQLNLSVTSGAYVAPPSSNGDGQPSIIQDSPAQKAGLQEKDIITKVNNTPISSTNSLTALLGRYSVGDKVTLTVLRDGKTITLSATLAAAPTS